VETNLNTVRAEPFDDAQDRPVEAPFASASVFTQVKQ